MMYGTHINTLQYDVRYTQRQIVHVYDILTFECTVGLGRQVIALLFEINIFNTIFISPISAKCFET